MIDPIIKALKERLAVAQANVDRIRAAITALGGGDGTDPQTARKTFAGHIDGNGKKPAKRKRAKFSPLGLANLRLGQARRHGDKEKVKALEAEIKKLETGK